MMDLSKIDELAARLSDALPPGAQQMRDQVEQQFRTLLHRTFEKMELVTREEFDIQTASLERARVKLTALEAQLEALEQQS